MFMDVLVSMHMLANSVLCSSVLQIQSFEAELPVPAIAEKEGGPPSFRGIFIRAPAILEAGPSVEVLADYPVPIKQIAKIASGSQTEQVFLFQPYFLSLDSHSCVFYSR